MLKLPLKEQIEKTIGQRVCIKNKNGTLRFFGSTLFADGLWYGIELDEEFGENDGIVNNVQYFTCRKNHGIFISASDSILTVNGSSKTNLEISTLSEDFSSKRLDRADCNVQNIDNCMPVSPESLKSKSFTISKEAYVGQLSMITEETFESEIYPKSTKVLCLDFDNELNKCTTLFDKKACTLFNQFPKQENNESHQGFEEYESDDSLGILPHILEEGQSCDNLILNDSKDSNDKENLNAMCFSNNIEKFINCQNVVIPCIDNGILTPSVSIMSKCPLLFKREESPVCSNASMPKFASTPKHETSYSFVIDEDIAVVDNFLYDLEFPINPSEIEKHSQFVLNKTEIVPNSENISPVKSNECKSFTVENRNLAPSILNATCIISDPIEENQIPFQKSSDKFNFLMDQESTVKSDNNLVDEFCVQEHGLLDYNNFIKHLNPNAFNAAHFTGNSFESNENKNDLDVTCKIVEPRELINVTKYLDTSNIQKNILNATISYAEVVENEKAKILNATISYSDVAKNKVLNGKAEVLNTTVSYSKDDESNTSVNKKSEILNTTISYSDLAKNKVLNDKAGVLNTTVSYSKDDKSNTSVNKKSEILNATISYSDVEENNIGIDSSVKILYTNLSYTEAAKSGIVVNDEAGILNTTYEKIESCDLDTNVNVLQTLKPAISNETKKGIQFGSKNKDAKLNSVCKKNLSSFKEGSEKICSVFNRNKQFRKSAGCFIKSGIVNADYKNQTRRNSISSSTPPSSKTDKSTIHSFNRNLYDKCPIDTKTVKKSSVYREPLTNPNSSYNACKVLCSSSSVKSNFTEDKHKAKNSVSKIKLKGHVLNNTKSLVSLLPDIQKTVKKPQCQPLMKNFIEDKHEIIDGHVFNETKSLTSCLSDLGKTVVKKPQNSMKTEDRDAKLDSGSKVNLNENQDPVPLLPDFGKTIVKKSRCSMNLEHRRNFSDPCKKPLFKSQNKIVATSSENNLLKISTVLGKDLSAQKSNKDSMIPGLKKPPVFSATTSEEKNQQTLRISEKRVLSQKNIPANSASINTNLRKPHSFIPAMKMNTKQNTSKTHSSNSPTRCLPVPKSCLNDTIIIPNHQVKLKPTSKEATNFSNIKEIGQISTRDSQNNDPDSAQNACLNKTVNVSDYQNKNGKSNQNCKLLPKSSRSSSRIPSISQNNRMKDSGVKSSLMIPRAEYKGKTQSQDNLR